MELFRPVGLDRLRAYLQTALQEPFAYVPAFSFLYREHLKQRDKWRPRDRLHSDDQVSYWTGNTKHFSS